MTVSQMREVDRLMVEVAGISMVQMMENAGRAVAQVVRRRLGGDLRDRRVVVLVGVGGNGGGGLVAARRMGSWGADVDVVLVSAADELRGVPALQLRSLFLAGVRVVSLRDAGPGTVVGSGIVDRIRHADVIVDALVGYGIVGGLRPDLGRLVELVNASAALVVSLDVPSGVDADTGLPTGPAVIAAATVTLALPKAGLLTVSGRDHVGDLYLADIGVPAEVYRRVGVEIGAVFANADVVRL